MKGPERPGLTGLGRDGPAGGPGLPPLHVTVPTERPEDLQLETDPEVLRQRLMRVRYGPVPVLRELDRYLERLHRARLPAQLRGELLALALGETVRAARELARRYRQQGGGIPEPAELGLGLGEAIHVAEQVGAGYKLLFLTFLGQGETSPAEAAAVRTLELLWLEQLLRGLRYQRLPARAWQDLNRIHQAARERGLEGRPHPLKVRLEVGPGQGAAVLQPPERLSLGQLYLLIQLKGLLDTTSWPLDQALRLDAYLAPLLGRLRVVEHGGGMVPQYHVAVEPHQARPPRLRWRQHPPAGALLLDLRPLLAQVKTDQRVLAGEEAARRPSPSPAPSPALEGLSPGERQAFLAQLQHLLLPRERLARRQRIYGLRYARLYVGFEDVHRLYRDLAVGAERDRAFWDRLAAYSQAVAEDEDPAAARWVVADEGTGGMQLRIQESRYSTPLQVGRLVAYGLCEDPPQQVRLGRVVRLERAGEREVEIAIARLPGEVRAVAVVGEDGAELPALLLEGTAGGHRLLADPDHPLVPGHHLRLRPWDGGPERHGTLGGPRLGTQDFTLFDLHPA